MVQLYTGDGKGKTTAALGLAIRAVGAGMRVFIGQFMKSGEFSELAALRQFGEAVIVRQYGSGMFVRGVPEQEDIDRAIRGLADCGEALVSGTFGLVIFDEAVTAVSSGLIEEEQVHAIISRCPATVELVLTGRDAPASLVERADLVTEMRNIKHYYDRGIAARTGFEQ